MRYPYVLVIGAFAFSFVLQEAAMVFEESGQFWLAFVADGLANVAMFGSGLAVGIWAAIREEDPTPRDKKR